MMQREVAYTALKEWHPTLVTNLEACVATGASSTEVLAKTKEFTPVDAPAYVWECIRLALEYLVMQRELTKHRN
jgi:hypothetical protein